MKIFMSYRRKDWSFARSLRKALLEYLDAEIFIDFEGVDEANFDSSIIRNLRTSDAFLLIVSENTFVDRVFRNTDWMHREILEALTLNIPIICAFINGQLIPEDIPEDIKLIRHMQGIKFYPEFFDSAVENLAKFIINITPVEARELSEDEIYILNIKKKSRLKLLEALRALERGDHTAYDELLKKARSLHKRLQRKGDKPQPKRKHPPPEVPLASPTEQSDDSPPRPETLPEEHPGHDGTLPRIADDIFTQSASTDNPLNWEDDPLRFPRFAQLPADNPLRIAANAAKRHSNGRTSTEILVWLLYFYPAGSVR